MSMYSDQPLVGSLNTSISYHDNSVAQTCTRKDTLAHSLGPPCLNDVMRSLTTEIVRAEIHQELLLSHFSLPVDLSIEKRQTKTKF